MSLTDVRQTLLQRQSDEHEAYIDGFRSFTDSADPKALILALRTATGDGLITRAGVRSPIWETDLHYRFIVTNDESRLTVQVEQDDGTVLSTVTWTANLDPETFYQLLVTAVRDAGHDLGVGLNDPTQSVEELSKMLVEVAGLRSQGLLGYRDLLTQVIERKNGWYFTERDVLPVHDLHYSIGVDRLGEQLWPEHLRNKGWYDAPYMIDFARRFYGTVPKPGDQQL